MTPGNEADLIFDDLVEELTAKLQAGEAVDIESYVVRHPERGDADPPDGRSSGRAR